MTEITDMLWQEEMPQKEAAISQTIVDLVFDINCRCLPVDHAYALSQAISKALPWFVQEPQAGLHLILMAESGSGWLRPESPDELLYLSRRTKLTLRLPQRCIAEAQALSGMTLEVAGYSIKVGNAKQKSFSKMPVLMAKYVIANSSQDEETFLKTAVAEIQQKGIACRKVLCGKTHRFKLPDGELFTRSLMIADLKPQDSIILQEEGLGDGRKMGCGLFIPHKDINPVSSKD
jgi:CRISPR-associated protein Cas6